MSVIQAERLTAIDRCDRCGAPAYIRAWLQNGSLLFCAHHGRKSMDALAKVALQIDDQTDQLVP